MASSSIPITRTRHKADDRTEEKCQLSPSRLNAAAREKERDELKETKLVSGSSWQQFSWNPETRSSQRRHCRSTVLAKPRDSFFSASSLPLSDPGDPATHIEMKRSKDLREEEEEEFCNRVVLFCTRRVIAANPKVRRASCDPCEEEEEKRSPF